MDSLDVLKVVYFDVAYSRGLDLFSMAFELLFWTRVHAVGIFQNLSHIWIFEKIVQTQCSKHHTNRIILFYIFDFFERLFFEQKFTHRTRMAMIFAWAAQTVVYTFFTFFWILVEIKSLDTLLALRRIITDQTILYLALDTLSIIEIKPCPTKSALTLGIPKTIGLIGNTLIWWF